MRRERFLRQRVAEARIAAEEAERAYRFLVAGAYRRTFNLMVRGGTRGANARAIILDALDGNVPSMEYVRLVFKERHRK